MWSRVVTLVLCVNAVISYRLQTPVVEVCPNALRVSIGDSSGIQLFAFHGNINRPIGETEAGQMSKDVNRKTFGRWVFETQSETLKLGDTINYWIYVIHRDLGYRSDIMRYTVNAFSSKCEAYENESSDEEEVLTDSKKFGRRRNKDENISHFRHHYHHHHHHEEGVTRRTGHGHYGWNPPPSRPPTNYPTLPPFPQPPMPLPFPGGPIAVCDCEQELKTLTKRLSETQGRLESMFNNTQILELEFQALSDILGNILDRTKFGRKLLLTGVFSANDNPYDLIKTILGDKLALNDLKLKVLSATTTVHGAIIFEMTTVSDKLRVLLRAKRLQNSKLRIIDFVEEENEIADIFQVTLSPESSSTSPIVDGPYPDIDVRFGEN